MSDDDGMSGWIVSEYRCGGRYLFDVEVPNGRIIATIASKYDREKYRKIAYLIVAAPKTAAERDKLRDVNAGLLVTLKAIGDYPVQSRPPGAPCSAIEWAERQIEHLSKLARAAIAKAEKQP
jgi:hypothetical protein